MIKRIFIVALALICSVTLLSACGKGKASASKALTLLENFKFDPAVHSGYVLKHEQTIDGILTNSRFSELSLSSGGTKGIFVETITALNPDVSEEEYRSSTTTITFNGSEIKKNGVVTDEYALSDLMTLNLFDASVIEGKLEDLAYQDSVLSFRVSGVYTGTVIGDSNGVDSVNVRVTTNKDCTAILSMSVEYSRNGVQTRVNLTIT